MLRGKVPRQQPQLSMPCMLCGPASRQASAAELLPGSKPMCPWCRSSAAAPSPETFLAVYASPVHECGGLALKCPVMLPVTPWLRSCTADMQ